MCKTGKKMKNLLFSVMLLLPISSVMAQDKPAPQQQTDQSRKIEQLIEQLGADKYEEREAAHAALTKIGKPAVKALLVARESKDLEVASRADELIEIITGQRVQPEKKPQETPSKPSPGPGVAPGPSIDPDALKDMLEKVESFGGLSPELKKTIEGFQKLFEESQSGTPDLSKIGELFEQFFNKKLPGSPRTRPELKPIPDDLAREPVRGDIEKELGITLSPVDAVMKAHIRISPDRADGSWDGLSHGLVVEKIDRNGRAFAQGLRQHDILIFVGTEAAPAVALPGPWRAWNAWRGKAVGAGSATSLNALKNKKLFIEVIRRGTSCRVIELSPTLKPRVPSNDTKDF